MRILLKHITQTTAGTASVREQWLDDPVITVGRATDQRLQSNDTQLQLHHAELRVTATGWQLVCIPPAQALVNDKACRDARLAVGDVVTLGALHLRIEAPTAAGEPQLSIERLPDPAAVATSMAASERASMASPKLSLSDLGWRQRPWAWALFLVTLLGGLVLPWTAGVPSDATWSSGPLHEAHASLEGQCDRCHVKPFERVRNESCLDCHADHLRTHVPAAHPATAQFKAQRCTDCHVEHDEPTHLVQTDNRVCTDCHAEPERHGARAGAKPVTDFASNHPPFRLSEWRSEQPASELKFTHAAHLDVRGVKAPSGTVVMQCADCHTPTEEGRSFQPIRMETHCASCHRLEFDPAEPARTVPHGDPTEVLRVLSGHYSARYLAGYADPLAGRAAGVLPPGVEVAPAERARLLGVARDRVLRVASDLCERRVCVDCHTVTRAGTALDPAWKVAPVKLVSNWMPGAEFDHALHGTSLTPCSTCHKAETSKQASDVLMPVIETCRDCHRGTMKTACSDCHGFHGKGQPLWQPATLKTVLRKASVP
ncbi:MAG: cytochrome c3 family protein [Nevskiaceae bacterium]